MPALGTAKLPFARTVYIDRDDFRLEDTPDYFCLAPGKTVSIFQAPYPITCVSYKTDPATGEVTELFCHLEDYPREGALKKRPKAFIQWVADHAESGSHIDAHLLPACQERQSARGTAGLQGRHRPAQPGNTEGRPCQSRLLGSREVRVRIRIAQEQGVHGASARG